jgi:hypothetical protein
MYQTSFHKTIAIAVILLLTNTAKSQLVNPDYLRKPWKAMWIMVPNTNPTGYGVYYFRKDFELTAVPENFIIHVSADNRYKLFVNEKLVSLGPARGDVLHWNFETINLAPFLHTGRNVVAAQVWNEGEFRQEANSSLRTAFILQGDNNETQILNTNSSWKCIQDSSYSPIKISIPTYYVAGAGERVDMQRFLKGWNKLNYSDTLWQNAKTIVPGYPKNKIGATGEPNGWMLIPSPLPQMELTPQRLVTVRKAGGVVVPTSFPSSKTVITVPANTTATILIDQTYLTNAYPDILFSGGKNSSITLSYQEALSVKYPEKGNRNEIDGKTMVGRSDSIFSDGSELQEFTTLSWRTYRYLQINITTKETPLLLEDVYGTFTGYPFVLNAKLETDNKELQKMFEIGWRTARLCAVETYMDCPYYEQLQYIGDTRIQALVSLYNSGDDHLVRNALNQIYYSQQPEGLTQSRYPTTTPQYIPPFSLWYIGMLHDYMMYGRDLAFVKDKLTSVRQVLNYFKNFQQADGSLKNLPWWNFTDWVEVKDWETGERSKGKDGNSAVLDLQLLWAYELAADMEQKLGNKENAAIYNQYVMQLKKTIQNKYWDNNKKLYADRSEKDLFSQHANALAILTGVVTDKNAVMLGRQLLTDTTLAPASIYFKYYLHLALVKAGFGNEYLGWLNKWRENIALGLTTWAEISEVASARSDCHAWGASPNIEFFRTVLGIDSDAPGFTKIKIEPHLGDIKKIGGVIPHPNGEVSVNYEVVNDKLNADVVLPVKTTGRFLWKGKTHSLKSGRNNIRL